MKKCLFLFVWSLKKKHLFLSNPSNAWQTLPELQRCYVAHANLIFAFYKDASALQPWTPEIFGDLRCPPFWDVKKCFWKKGGGESVRIILLEFGKLPFWKCQIEICNASLVQTSGSDCLNLHLRGASKKLLNILSINSPPPERPKKNENNSM